MPEVSVGSQVFDVVFHPNRPIVYTGLLTGHIKAFSYNSQGSPSPVFSVRPSKRSCRGLSLNDDGSKLYSVGKAKALNIIDTATQSIDSRSGAHDAAINRVKSLMPWMVATGDDDGTVKLWDPRQREVAKTYTQHFDYISDFLWLPDKKQLVSTSGDGSLSVIDIRSKKPEPIAHSEDQEDELLSIIAIKGSTKVLVGTQIGVISVFNRNKGWGDCVDRIPGHPLSVDALCNVPAGIDGVDYESTVLTGSSDGYVRAVQILPTKLLGVVADHGEFPVERVAVGEGEGVPADEDAADDTKVRSVVDVDEGAEGEEGLSRGKRWWVGSVGHDDVLRLTDLGRFFKESAKDEELDADEDDADSETDDEEFLGIEEKAEVAKDDGDEDWSDEEEDEEEENSLLKDTLATAPKPPLALAQPPKPFLKHTVEADSDDDSDNDQTKKKNTKRKFAEQEKDSICKSKKGKKEPQVMGKGFFDGL